MKGDLTKIRHGAWRRALPRQLSTPLGPVDLWLSAATLALLVIGIVMVYSATIGPESIERAAPTRLLGRHLFNVGMATLALMGGLLVPFRYWRRFAYYFLLASLVLMTVVLVFGTIYGKSRRWLDLGVTHVQPAEFAKFAFVLYLARSIADKTEQMKRFSHGFLPHLLVLILITILALAQPDLGTCLILATLMVMLLFVAGTRVSYIVALFFLSLPAVARAIAMSSARMDRILAYMDPWSYRYKEGFQTVNSLTTLGSGGLTGLGLGAGRQSLGGFLPEAENDFILSVVGEQLGFVGVAVVLLLFVVITLRGAAVAYRLRDDFGRFLALGLTLLLGLQAAVNAAVAVGLVPTKGLTLPFVSYGGTSLMVSMLCMGVLLHLSREAAGTNEEGASEASREGNR